MNTTFETFKKRCTEIVTEDATVGVYTYGETNAKITGFVIAAGWLSDFQVHDLQKELFDLNKSIRAKKEKV
jgi:uncharacterized membrane protein